MASLIKVYDDGIPITKKRKRVSKNKKKNWRKHADITDVETYLDDKRLQERTGGVASEKPNEQLFYVDVKQDLSIKSPVQASGKKKEAGKPLRCHASLEPDTRIPLVRPNLNVPHNVCTSKRFEITRTPDGSLSKRSLRVSQQREQAEQQRQLKRKAKEATAPDFDLWGSKDITKTDASLDEHYATVCKLTRQRPPKHYLSKPSGVAAVEVAPPGASYNPTFDDHQQLLQSALEIEQKKDKVERRILRAVDVGLTSPQEAQATWLQEMSAGLYDKDDQSGAVETPSVLDQSDRLTSNPAVRREDKKTERERKKLKERENKAKAEVKEKESKLKKQELFRLKSIKRDVKRREFELAARAARRELKKEETKDNPKKLGRLKFEPASVEIKLGDELEGSLRLLKPEGHLLVDRFKSLQKRNIIEPRTRAKFERKYTPKEFEKKGHKSISL